MAMANSTGHSPVVPCSVDRSPEDRARKLARLEALAASLKSVLADCPATDPESRARIQTAATAAAQLVAYLRSQEPLEAQIERLMVERSHALADMRQAGRDLERFNAAARREAELAVRIRRLRAEVSRHG